MCEGAGALDVQDLVARYAAGLFPMDDPEADVPHLELPWWTADPRAVFELDEPSLAALERRVGRSLKAAEPSWRLVTDTHFDEVLDRCAQPRSPGDGVWLTPRMRELYGTLRAAGLAHTFELVVESQGDSTIGGSLREPPRPGLVVESRGDSTSGGTLLAGIIAVTLGRAAMLESMCHTVPHAGNVLLARTLRALAGAGCELCDIQTPTDHTMRLGARLIPRAEYERRLAAALDLSA